MKTIVSVLTAAAIAVLPIGAHAQGILPDSANDPSITAADIARACSVYGLMARAVMETRQAGVLMSEVIEITGYTDDVIALAELAFMAPRFSPGKTQRDVIQNFQADAEARCFLEWRQGK
jgi:hypothetical protein